MTDNQKNLILRLRKDGEGYKTIANTVGLSRDRVRSFCKSKNIAGFGTAAALNMEEQADDGNICPNCYAPIAQSTKGRRKKFCSEKCRREWWKNHPDKVSRSEEASYKLKCHGCGKEFISYGNRNRKYCSHECYIKSRFYEEEEYEKGYGMENAAYR